MRSLDPGIRQYFAALALIATLACSAHSMAQPCFGERISIPSTSGVAFSHAIDDMNGDAVPDVVVANPGGDSILVFLSDGSDPPAFSEHAVGANSGASVVVATGDLNGDGHIDIVAGELSTGEVAWYVNDGLSAPSFSRRLVTDLAQDVNTVRIADMDGDGDMDIVSSNEFETGPFIEPDTSTLVWYENVTGTGRTFVRRSIFDTTAQRAWNAEIVDLDGDGDNDIVALVELLNPPDEGDDAVFWFENDAGAPPSFEPHMIDPNALFSATDVQPGDFDGDGAVDIAVSMSNGGGRGVWWYRNENESDPVFSPINQISDRGAFDLESVDLDSDGIDDLIATTVGIDGLRWYSLTEGSGEPTFVELNIVANGFSPLTVKAGDLNMDGLMDLVSLSDLDSDPLAWHPMIAVRNYTAGTSYFDLRSAIASALNGDLISARSEHIGRECAPVVDLAGKAITIEIDGAIERDWGTTTELADGAALVAGPSSGMNIQGVLTVPEDSAAALSASQGIDLPAEIVMQPSSSLFVDGPTTVVSEVGIANIHPVFPPRRGFDSDMAGMLTADFDRDGLVDILQLDPFSALGVFHNRGVQADGRVAFDPITIPRSFGIFGNLNDISPIAIADVNADGYPDFVIADSTNQQIEWYRNLGQSPPSFEQLLVAMTSNSPVAVAVADLDGDGDADIAVVGSEPMTLEWHENQDSVGGSFVRHEIAGWDQAGDSAISAGDLNGDGRSDLVLTAPVDFLPTFFLELTGFIQNEDATGFTRTNLADGLLGPLRTAVMSDLDGDGDLDLVTSHAVSTETIVFENDGSDQPEFRKVDSWQSYTSAIGDLDKDGDTDVLLGSLRGGGAVWLDNQSRNEIQFEEMQLTETTVSLFADLADVDDDGDEDIVSQESFELSWLENAFASPLVVADGGAFSTNSALDVVRRVVRVPVDSILQSTALTINRTSSLTGSGLASAPSILSAGTIEPEPGAVLTLDGDYTQSFDDGIAGAIAGTLKTDLGDGSAPSRVDVSGSAALAGDLSVSAAPEFDPMVGEAFDVLTASSVLDRFDVAFLPGLPPDGMGNGRFLRVRYPVSEGGRGTVSVSLVVDTLTGDITTDPPETFEVDGRITDAALGDLNGDGLIDLAVTVPDEDSPGAAPGSLIVLFNAGVSNGFWQGFSSSVLVTVGRRPEGVAVGNIDGAGGLDIAVTNRSDDTAMLITNDGLGSISSFSIALTVDTGDEPVGAVLADIDNDKFDDLIVTEFGSDSVGVFTNSGFGRSVSRGSWSGIGARSAYPVGDQPLRTVVADIDNDKFDDLVAANAGDGTISRLRNSFGSGFEAQIVSLVGAQPIRLIAADLTEDNAEDIAVVNRVGDSVSVLLSTAGFNLTSASTLPVGNAPSSLAAVDLDGDGDRDLAVVAEQGGAREVRVLRNDFTDGQLIFAPATTIETGADPLLVLAGDVNNDGQDDLVTVNRDTGGSQRLASRGAASGDVSVVLRSAPCGDANGDGLVDTNDIGFVLKRLGKTGPAGDANGDGAVDVNDISYVLFRLGSACP